MQSRVTLHLYPVAVVPRRQHMKRQVAQFLNYMVNEKNYSANTTAAYQERSVPIFGVSGRRRAVRAEHRRLARCERAGRAELRAIPQGTRLCSSTVARKVASVKSFLHYLVNSGHLNTDPSDRLDSPKVKKNLPRAIHLDEIVRLMAAPAGDHSPKALRDKALLEMLYATGMRHRAGQPRPRKRRSGFKLVTGERQTQAHRADLRRRLTSGRGVSARRPAPTRGQPL